VGRAILAEMSDAALAKWIAAHRFTSYSPLSEKDASRFRADVLRARELGYAVADQQLELGWRGLAVALRNRHGECLGALGVTMPAERMSVEQMVKTMLPPLREAESGLRGLL
jgi:IclR family pca regulon transcriptional regulator